MPKTASEVNLAAMVTSSSAASLPGTANNSAASPAASTIHKVAVSDVVAVVVDVEMISSKVALLIVLNYYLYLLYWNDFQ